MLLPHERLLADCVTAAVTGRPLSLPYETYDWAAFVLATVRHGVAQPAAVLLLGREIPEQVRGALSRLIEGNRARNRTIYAETERLLCALSADNIEALVLKGTALSLTVYTDFAHRSFADVDILVREEDFERADAAVLKAGWRLQDGEREPGHHHVIYERFLTEDILTATVTPEFDPSLTPERLAPHTYRLRLELHRSPFFDVSGTAVTMDLTPFWQGAHAAAFPTGAHFLTPGPEATLVHLCAHAASHAFHKAQFVLDVALLLQRYGQGMNPATLADLTSRYAASAHVHRMLGFLDREIGIPTKHLLSGPAASYAPLSWQAIFDANGSEKAENRLRHWLAAGSSRERLQGALRMIFPTPAAMRRIYGVYHPALLAALYVWRPVQLTGRLLKVLVRQAQLNVRDRQRPRKEYPCPGSEPS